MFEIVFDLRMNSISIFGQIKNCQAKKKNQIKICKLIGNELRALML